MRALFTIALLHLLLLSPAAAQERNENLDRNLAKWRSEYAEAVKLYQIAPIAERSKQLAKICATAAPEIRVTDTLDPNLDLSTFEITVANNTIPIPPGLDRVEALLTYAVPIEGEIEARQRDESVLLELERPGGEGTPIPFELFVRVRRL